MTEFFKKAFNDMKESAKAQHEVDSANYAATKAEAKAQWEEAKASPKIQEKKRLEAQQEQLQEAKERTEAAQKRIDEAKAIKG